MSYFSWPNSSPAADSRAVLGSFTPLLPIQLHFFLFCYEKPSPQHVLEESVSCAVAAAPGTAASGSVHPRGCSELTHPGRHQAPVQPQPLHLKASS